MFLASSKGGGGQYKHKGGQMLPPAPPERNPVLLSYTCIEYFLMSLHHTPHELYMRVLNCENKSFKLPEKEGMKIP